MENFDIKIVQTWKGCVIAAAVIAFPLMYRNARAAFEQVDVSLIEAGRTLGMSEWSIFRRVVIPVAAPGIASGTVLAFARAIGEYGATSMLAGNILGKTRTVSVAIASRDCSRELWNGRFLGCCHCSDFLCCGCCDQYDFRQGNEGKKVDLNGGKCKYREKFPGISFEDSI